MKAGLDPEVRQSIRIRLWDSVSELSDFERQKATWGQTDNPHFSYVEYCECFFDCLPDGTEAAQRYGLVSEEEQAVLTPLFDALADHKSPTGNDRDDQIILADPKWYDVVVAAQKSRNSLLGLLDDEEAKRLSHKAHPTQTGTIR